ncbi:hypothetical protein [Streptomyces anulatus]|uniref:DUF3168 domain-containing protein n=1 Tax=Streptomyces anulatus TaxID=1892 RepID=A0ABZ1ZIX0_STRAQ|nr:hypothetical protein [Streptomyces anulatus]
MTPEDLLWGDIEHAAALIVRTAMPGTRVVNELPADLEKKLPLVQVQILPGGGDDGVTDTALVDVDTFAATRTAMWDLARDVRAALLAAAGTHVPGARVVIDTVETTSRPAPVSYGNPAIRRAVATYALTSRAQAPA